MIALALFVSFVVGQKWTLFSDAAGETRFRLVAGNNEPVLASEGYSSKNGAVAGIASVKAAAMMMSNFEIKMSTNNKFYFVVKAANSMVIGTSELYDQMSGATSGITAVMTAAAAAETIVDQTSSSAAAADGTFQLYKDASDEFRFRLLAGNSEPILSSESYASKSGALNGIESVRANVLQLSSFSLLMSSNGQFYFNLLANNNQVIGVSELYKTAGGRAVGQFAVIRIAPDAPLIDLTLGSAPERKGRFIIYESLAGSFRFTLQAKNYQVILTSESYTTKASAMNGIESVKTNAPNAASFKNMNASNGEFYFVLRAGNNQVIGNSETYKTTQSRDNGIASVMATAPTAEIIDNTIDNRYVGKFEVFRDAPTGTKYYFRLRSVNGASLIVSSAYANMNDVTAAISAVKAAANVDARFIKNDAALSFKVVNSNNVDIAFSDVYSSLAARDAGIASVQATAPNAITVVLTWIAPTTSVGETTTTTMTPTTVATVAGQTTTTVLDTPPVETTTTAQITINVSETFGATTTTSTIPIQIITVTADPMMTVPTTPEVTNNLQSTMTIKGNSASSLAALVGSHAVAVAFVAAALL